MKNTFNFLLLSSIVYISCNNDKVSRYNDKVQVNDTVITLIFKSRRFDKDTISNISGAKTLRLKDLGYSRVTNFREYQIPKRNYKRNDTVRIVSNEDIVLSHGYHYYHYSLFRFKPGDTVVFDYKNDAPYCSIKNRKVSSEDLNFFTNLNLQSKIIEDDNVFFQNNMRFRTQAEIESYKIKTIELLKVKLSKLDSIYNKKLMSKEIYQMYLTDIGAKLNTVYEKTMFEKELDLYLPNVRYALIDYFNSIYHPKLIKEKNSSYFDSKIQFDHVLAIKNINESNKNFLLYFFFEQVAQTYSIDIVNAYYSKLKNTSIEKSILEDLEKRFLIDLSSLKKKSENIYVITNRKEKITLNEFISLNKGSILYLDFWASWCAPCIESMPASRKLQSEYRNENIIFLFLSIDNDFEKWQNASQREGLSLNKNNFLAINYPTALFYQELQLESIPRYLIFDKNGNLANKNAPRPESKEIRRELNKLLEKK